MQARSKCKKQMISFVFTKSVVGIVLDLPCGHLTQKSQTTWFFVDNNYVVACHRKYNEKN